MKIKPTAIILTVILGCGLIFGGVEYAKYRINQYNQFPQGLYINNVDCSGLTVAQAKTLLSDTWNQREFTITENGETVDKIDDLDLTYDIDHDLSSAMKAFGNVGFIHDKLTQKLSTKLDMKAESVSNNLSKQIDDLNILEDNSTVQTHDAYVDKSTTNFKIVKEVYGNNIDKEKVTQSILNHISSDNWTMTFNEKDYYSVPTITSDDKVLQDEMEYCEKYLNYGITYTFGSDKRIVTPEEIDKMVKYKDDGKAKVNEEEVEDFVSELADDYNTVGHTRSFKSTNRGTIKIHGGSYGYKIDESEEADALTEVLKEGKAVTREPEYSRKGHSRDGLNDIGSTYAEVDVGGQHVWYYKNGELILSTDVVTGKVKAEKYHQTPTGVYYIVTKQRNRTLRGMEDDGKTKYESEVKYWMPFCGGNGFHDADWRSKFGGDIYVSNGSHGCVNMPPAAAGKLYENISVGCPVIVYR